MSTSTPDLSFGTNLRGHARRDIGGRRKAAPPPRLPSTVEHAGRDRARGSGASTTAAPRWTRSARRTRPPRPARRCRRVRSSRRIGKSPEAGAGLRETLSVRKDRRSRSKCTAPRNVGAVIRLATRKRVDQVEAAVDDHDRRIRHVLGQPGWGDKIAAVIHARTSLARRLSRTSPGRTRPNSSTRGRRLHRVTPVWTGAARWRSELSVFATWLAARDLVALRMMGATLDRRERNPQADLRPTRWRSCSSTSSGRRSRARNDPGS